MESHRRHNGSGTRSDVQHYAREVIGIGTITFTGRLHAADLNTHRLQVKDDVGHQVALPNVPNDAEVSRLIGSYVAVSGAPERDAQGRLTHIHDAAVVAAANPLGGSVVPGAVSLDEILATAPGPDVDDGIELTDEEFDSFFEVMGLERRLGTQTSSAKPDLDLD